MKGEDRSLTLVLFVVEVVDPAEMSVCPSVFFEYFTECILYNKIILHHCTLEALKRKYVNIFPSICVLH